ncbi:hypothetical protein H2Y56_06015 [Pectobacterium aroidearum]|uniref:Uncharacterized protein n=1 Tax=Pectobacterium aroidearum TaxID=1201031 RepID=A0ABR5ZAT2_9GAMM|nr:MULTISPECIES: hypothetical protein [Pectobacterium]MBA5198882.1 hypothetical protein [Pectobacterium aroidearum]MBA5231674.1 hypothetical protein [Pectobacterium aroidearum]MBA5736852.1 hypothetical protein [Pectobacterium aroidearum]UXJ98911.1 hypothetical protein N5056_13880 [Pectobacterium aroidearum]GKV93545.1 hypothetical protein PEC301645_09920 [Pectobacterium carotovorum subsp. carotovorum]
MYENSDYLPAGLPINIAEWPREFQDKLELDKRANQLINSLIAGKTLRRHVERELDTVAEQYREHFRARLNHWREYHDQKRGKTK